MITDASQQFCVATNAFGATTVLGSIVLRPHDLGRGRPIFVHVHVTTAFVDSGTSQWRLDLGTGSTPAFYLGSTGPIPVAELRLNTHHYLTVGPWQEVNPLTPGLAGVTVAGLEQLPPYHLPPGHGSGLGLAVGYSPVFAASTVTGTGCSAGAVTVELVDQPSLVGRVYPAGTTGSFNR